MPQTLAFALIGARNSDIKHRAIATDVALVAGGAAITSLCAQITIPLNPVPFTLQTFAVLLCGLSLGSRLGTSSQLLYLCLGACNLRVFAHGSHGAGIIVGPTAGYLLSYPIAGYVLGRFAEAGWDRNVFRLAAAMAAATVIVLGCGWAWLSYYIGAGHAFAKGVGPFLGVEVLKALAVTGLLPTVWKLIPVPRRNA